MKSDIMFDILFMIFVMAFVPFMMQSEETVLQMETTGVQQHSFFGQEPPGLEPEVFAPGADLLTAYELHGFPTFSRDGNDMYWPIIPPRIIHLEQAGDMETEVVHIFGDSIQALFFTSNSNRLYFQLTRENGSEGFNIWYVDQTDQGWGKPVYLGEHANPGIIESQPSLTIDKTLYYSGSLTEDGFNRGIFRTRLVEGRYETPELLPSPINTEFIDVNPFIVSDESFLLFSSSRPDMDEQHLKLFVSHRDDDGKWQTPINLSNKLRIESPVKFASISPDGNYLFFLTEENIYWVDAAVISNEQIRQLGS